MQIRNSAPIELALRNFHFRDNVVNRTIQRLASSKRILSAADDAAGLAVNNSIKIRVLGYRQALKNIQDGVSLLQTTESGLEDVDYALQKMRELAVQAANDTLTDADRQLIQQDLDEMVQAIDKTAEQTTFNGRELMTGHLDVNEWQRDPEKINVKEVAVIGTPAYGYYTVKLNSEASAATQTSATKISSHQRDNLTADYAGGANQKIAEADIGGALMIKSDGSIPYDFNAADTIEMLNYLKINDASGDAAAVNGNILTDGSSDYTLTENNDGDVQLTTNNGAGYIYSYTDTTPVQVAGQEQIKVDKVIEDIGSTGSANLINGGFAGYIYVDNARLSNGSIVDYQQGGIIEPWDSSDITNDTVTEQYAVNTNTQTVGAGGVISLDGNGTVTGSGAADLTALSGAGLSLAAFPSLPSILVSQALASETISGSSIHSKSVYKYTYGATTNGTVSNINTGTVQVAGGNTYSDNLVASVAAVNDETDTGNYYVNGLNIYFHGESADLNSKTVTFRADVDNQTTTAQGDWTNDAGNIYYINLEGSYFGGFNKDSGDLNTLVAGYGDLDTNGEYYINGNKLYFYNDGGVSWASQIDYTANMSDTMTDGADLNVQQSAIYKYTVAGSNAGGTNIVSVTADANFVTEKAVLDIDSAGNYDFDSANKLIYTYGNLDTQTVNYEMTNRRFSNSELGESLSNQTLTPKYSSGGVTITAKQGATATYEGDLTYKDGLYETLTLKGPGQLGGGADFVIESMSDGLNGTMTEGAGADFTLNTGTGLVTATANILGFGLDAKSTYTYDAKYQISSFNGDTGVITVNSLGYQASKLGDVTSSGTGINDITYDSFHNLEATYLQMSEAPIVDDNTGMSTADVNNAQRTSVWVSNTASPTTVYTLGSDYTIEGKSIRITPGGALDADSDGTPDADFTVDYAYNSKTTGISLDLNTQLGESPGGNADNYQANDGLFTDFTNNDSISFTIDDRTYTYSVSPTETIQDLIDKINTESDSIYSNSSEIDDSDAYMGSGSLNNAGIWASFNGSQIVLSSRDEEKNYGYKGSRFNITVNDGQVGPGNFFDFVAGGGSNPNITITNPSGVSFNSTSEDGSYFFNNEEGDVDGIPGIRLKLKEDSIAGSESQIEITSYMVQAGPMTSQELPITCPDMRSSALGVNSLNLSSSTDAETAISIIDDAIKTVYTQRAKVGITMNRFAAVTRTVAETEYNLQSASSRIEDAEIAHESMEYAKSKLTTTTALDSVVQYQMREGSNILGLLR